MITLKDDQELISIESWDQILSRPGYSGNVDPESAKLKEIIGNYYLPSEVPCGLSSCHQQHLKGYVVSTVAGAITNVGHVCGKKYFGVEFEQMRRQFDRDVRMQSYREELSAFQRRIPEIESAIEDLRTEAFGADWVNRQVTALLTPGNGIDTVRTTLMDMVKRQDERITIPREATKEEKAAAEERERRTIEGPMYIDEVVGRLMGLSTLADQNSLREILILDLEVGLKRVAQLDVDTAIETVLARESRWAGEVAQKLELANLNIRTGRQLFTKRNLRQLEHLIKAERERAAFRAIMTDMPLGNSA